ncbi:hypothetical protein TNCV_249861 [Trichonephila clavipes]|nr:hypothetical protein TNCV_249861 [Trichonephila clavipes]
MLTITVQHISYEIQLKRTLMYYPLAVGEDSLLYSKLVLAENGRGGSDFRLTLYKRSDDSHLSDEQQLLYLTRSISRNVQEAFFLAWTAYSSSSTSIMSDDMERRSFAKLKM